MTANPSPDPQVTAQQIAMYGRRLLADRLVTGSAGNISCRLADGIAITPSGVAYDTIDAADICLVDQQGTKLSGTGIPSSEYPMHHLVYDGFPEAQAVVHTHSLAAVTVSTLVDALPAVHYYILRFGGSDVRVAPFRTFGSEGLARAVHSAMTDRSAVLLQNHGAVTFGSTLAQAYERAELLEWLCEVWLRAAAVGSPHIISDDQLAEVTVATRALQARKRAAG